MADTTTSPGFDGRKSVYDEGDKCVHAICKFMADTTTSPGIDGRKCVYDAFKKSTHSNGINMVEYKYMFGKVLEPQLMIMKMIGSDRKRLYIFSETVKVTKKARMDNESG
eukprot:6690848-Ditylum_brightwellii.AAC.1